MFETIVLSSLVSVKTQKVFNYLIILYSDAKKKVCTVHFINAHDVLRNMLRNTIFHTMVNDHVSYTVHLSKQ